MSRDYAHEDWIPWYVRDAASWLELSLAARGAAEGIARKMNLAPDLPLGSRGLRGLARTLGCSWEELEPALAELLAPGPGGEPPRLVHDAERNVLHDPEAARRRRPTSTERVRNFRSKRTSEHPASETHETVSPVSSVPETSKCVPSNLISSDLISLGIPEEIPSARATPSVAADPANDAPDWWPGVIATIASGTGVDLPEREAWLRYAGHRASKARPAERRDAVHWLTTVMVKEAREDREKARHQRERDAKFDARRAGPASPADGQKISITEQKELAERFPMRPRDRGAA